MRDDQDEENRLNEVERIDRLNHPGNIDAEYAVLGAIYLDNEMIPEISGLLSPDDFRDDNNRVIYRVMQSLYEQGQTVDYITVPEELRRTNQVDQAGGIANAVHSRYANLCVVAWRGIPYAEIVAEHARKRQIFDHTQRVVAKIWQPDVKSAQALALIAQEFQPLADKWENAGEIGGDIQPLDELLRGEIPEIHWTLPGMLPEGLAIIGAPPKTGKSALALQLSLAIGSGGYALGNSRAAQGDVLYLDLEDSAARLKERVERQLNGECIPHNVHIALHSPPMLEGGLIKIESWLRTHPDAQAVIIDTLSVFRGIGSQTEKGNIFNADYDDMQKLHRLGLQHHVAVVVLHHLTKNSGVSDPLQMLSGTTGLSAAADVVWILSRERNQELGELQIVGRDVFEQNIAMRFSADMLLWQAVGDAAEVAYKVGEKKVIDALSELRHAATPSEIANMTGDTPASTRQRLVRMRNAGLLTSVGTGKYWLAANRQKAQ